MEDKELIKETIKFIKAYKNYIPANYKAQKLIEKWEDKLNKR